MNNKTPKWVLQSFEALAASEEQMPVPESLKSEESNWESRAAESMIAAAFTTVRFKQLGSLDSRTFGAIIGHLMAYTDKVMAPDAPTVELTELSPEAIELLNQTGQRIIEVLVKRQECIGHIVTTALRAPEEERHDFFDGFHKALKASSTGPKVRENSDILLLLFLRQPKVRQFTNVDELHAWLKEILGRNRAGSKKRIEKLCQRIGLTFRNRGRPKGKKKTK